MDFSGFGRPRVRPVSRESPVSLKIKSSTLPIGPMLSDFPEEGIMLNGRKNTIIGLTAIFTFVLVELAAIASAIVVVLQFAFDVDFPLFSSSDE